MGVIRKWIFPVLRILIFAAVAVALVKIAFFADEVTTTSPDIPTGSIIEPEVTATLTTIKNDVTLTGTVAADEAVAVKATVAGVVRKLLATVGQHVDAGTVVLTLRTETPNPDGTLAIKDTNVVAPVAGTLSSLSALVGQVFSIGDAVAQVAPPSFNVSGSLPASQLYRLLNQPTDAQVSISGGPAPFTCGGLTIIAPLAGAVTESGEPAGSSGGGTAGPTLRCAVPAEVKVFSGLSAQIVVAGGVAENTLSVPITAAEGTAQSGFVYFVLEDGTPERRPVKLGLNDGTNVQVLEGLAEGDAVLAFVPGAVAVDPVTGEECVVLPDGSNSCGAP